MIDGKFLSILIEKKEYIESTVTTLSYVYSKNMRVSDVDITTCLPGYTFGTEVFYCVKTPFNITLTLRAVGKTKKYCKELKNNNINYFSVFKNTIYISCKLYEYSCLRNLYDITCKYKPYISNILVYTDIKYSSAYYLYKLLVPNYDDIAENFSELRYYILINENKVLTISEYEIIISSAICNIVNKTRYLKLLENKEMFNTLFNKLCEG